VSAAWVAGSVRARAMARRRYGAAATRRLAASPSLADALDVLSRTAYGRDIRPGQSLAEAQRALGATVLWHLRVLAGWMPRPGADIVRLLAAGFELANLDELLGALRGRPALPAYRLGTVATAWPRLARAGSLGEVRDVLAGSAWGDPGGSSGRAIQAGTRLSWAARVAALIGPAAPWAAGAAALLVAREVHVSGLRLADSQLQVARTVLGAATEATSYAAFRADLPNSAGWVLTGVTDTADLWRAEAAWWRRVEDDGFALLHRGGFDDGALVGAAAVLAADAWRVRAALEVAARGGAGLEVFDVLA
jgi:hypothetical protein